MIAENKAMSSYEKIMGKNKYTVTNIHPVHTEAEDRKKRKAISDTLYNVFKKY